MNKGSKTHVDRLKSKSSTKQDSWWLKKLKDEPFKVASISALTFGGVMLIMFFGNLQELPDLDLKSSAALLWALAVIGGVVTVFLLAVPALPGLHVKGEPGAWRSSSSHLLSVSAPAVATVTWLLVSVALDLKSTSMLQFLGLFFGIFLISYEARLGRFMREVHAPSEKQPSKIDLLVDMLVGSMAWFVTLGLGFVFAIALYAQQQFDGWVLMVVIVAQLSLTYVAALAAAQLDWAKEKKVLFALAFATVLLPALASKNVSAIGVAAVRALGLGDRPVRLVVSAAGCDVLNKAAGQKVCQLSATDSRAVVCPAILKSRIGTPYFIELSPIGEDQKWPEHKRHPLIPLSSSDVLSWPRLDLTGQTDDSVIRPSAESAQAASAASLPGTNHAGLGSAIPTQSSASAPAHVTSRKPYLTYLNDAGLSPGQREWLKRECSVDTASGR